MSLHLCKLECLRKFEAESKSDDNSVDFEDTINFTGSDTVHEIPWVNVPSHTQSIVPFLCHADTLPFASPASAAVNNSSPNHKEVKATCPACYLDFPIDEIETHADVCVDQFDPVGTVNFEVESEIPDEPNEPVIYQIPANDDENGSISTLKKIKEVVSNLHECVDMENINRVSIRRKYAFQDYLEAIARQRKRKRFNEKGMLKITFIGEPAVDDGGPRREFFSEALEQIGRRLFRDGFPVVNMTALAHEEFKVAGEIMASSVVLGGPAPCVLSTSAYAYVVHGVSSVKADDANDIVEDACLKETIEKLRRCDDDGTFQNTLMSDDVFNVLEKVGYRGVPSRETLATRDDIVRSIVMFDFSTKMPMLDQIIEGLRSFGMLECIKENAKLLEPVFGVSTIFSVNAEVFLESMHGEFSEHGSNTKDVEINIFKFFSDYIEDCECSENQQGSLSSLLLFITGSNAVPPLGFSKGITVKFKHGCLDRCRCRPTTSTCDLSVTFPVHCYGPDDFNMMISSALVEGVGFGNL